MEREDDMYIRYALRMRMGPVGCLGMIQADPGADGLLLAPFGGLDQGTALRSRCILNRRF